MEPIEISLNVNGAAAIATAEPRTSLADFLRHNIGLTGTHLGCEHGVCGACTLLVDGYAIRSCLMLAVQAEGAEVRTIEGLAPVQGELGPLQRALAKHHGLQCGFCTPGILATMTEFIAGNPSPSEAEIREALSGNICRCTGYEGIVDAMLEAAAELRGEAVTETSS